MEIRKFFISLVSKFDNKGFAQADKEGKKLAKTVNSMTKSFESLIKSELRAAQSALKLSKAEGKAADNIDDLKRKVEALKKKLDEVKRKNDTVAGSFERAGAAMGKASAALAPFAALGRAAAGGLLAVAGAGVAVATGVIRTGTSFESLRARLKTVEGSAAGAQAAFSQIQEFTKTTPFQLEEVTTAFVRLKSLGLDASQDSLKAFGNLAAAQGKSIIDFIEAVADASTGEFERLKEFGIKASSQGDKVAFTFKGTTTTVGKNAAEIQAFLKGLGETEFAGAMDDQMATAAGAISNLKDTFQTFLDQVAQMGVLDEFKLLLKDLSNLAGGEGFARILADSLVTALRAVREALANITEEDIRGFLNGAKSLAESFADALKFAAAALEVFTIASGGTGEAIQNMTLLMGALVAAMTGPAGIVVAAGLVGYALGQMLGALVFNMDEVNAKLDALDVRMARLRQEIAASEAAASAAEARAQQRLDAADKRSAAYAEQGRKQVKAIVGETEAGKGLLRELSDEEAGFRARQIARGTEEEQAQGRAALLTEAGQAVLGAVEKAEAKKISQVEARARREAKRRGASAAEIESAGRSARLAATQAATANRQEAFKKAQKTLEETGSTEAAAAIAARQVAGRGKKAGLGGGGKGDQFFEFEKQAGAAAKTQAEKFAGEELRRLRSEGVAVEAALEQSRAAGKERAAELKQRFLEAGRIFDASANNILDVLGLRGPGSVLEGRPPPQSLIIAPHFEINFIKQFTQTIDQVTGAKALAEVTGEAGEEAIKQGLEPNQKTFEGIVRGVLNLEMERFVKLAGGGALPQGPEGG